MKQLFSAVLIPFLPTLSSAQGWLDTPRYLECVTTR